MKGFFIYATSVSVDEFFLLKYLGNSSQFDVSCLTGEIVDYVKLIKH